MINWKIVVIFPLFAIIVSIFSGIAGGVSFLDLVLRAFLWGIVFGGIGLGVSFIIERFFPELKSAVERDNERVGQRASGEGSFEAFIPEENPHELEEMKTSYFDNDEGEGEVRDDGGEEMAASGHTEEDEDIGVLSDMEEGAKIGGKKRGAGIGNRDSEVESDYASEGGSGMQSMDESETEESPGTKSFEEPANTDMDDSGLVFDDDSIDKLPDSSGFEDSGSLSSSDSSFDSGGSFSKPYKNASVSEFEQDPYKTAKAIHTMIQRDKEG